MSSNGEISYVILVYISNMYVRIPIFSFFSHFRRFESCDAAYINQMHSTCGGPYIYIYIFKFANKIKYIWIISYMYGLEEMTIEEKNQMLGHFGTVCQMTCLFKDEKGVEEVVKGEQGSLISAKYLSTACDRVGPFTMVHQLLS